MVDSQAIPRQPQFNGATRVPEDRAARLMRMADDELLRIQAKRRALELDEALRSKDRPKLMASILSPLEFGAMPDVQHIIKGVLTQNSYGLLVGRDSTYKSFTALDMALCAATGRPWQDHEVNMPEGRPSVLYIASEGAYGMVPRIKAWLTHHGLTLDDLYVPYPAGSLNAKEHPEGKVRFHLMVRPVNLFTGPDAGELVSLIRQHSDVGLVVLDTLRRSSGSAEQNGSDMGVVVDNISRIKEAMDGGSVLVLAHTDKNDGDTRGSSMVEDDADVVWHARKPEGKRKSTRITLVNRKMKDGPAHDNIILEPEEVGDSLVMVRPDPFASVASGCTDREREVLGIVVLMFEAGQKATPAAIRRVFKEHHGNDLAESSAFEALKKLKASGLITQAKSGAGYEPAAGDALELEE